MLVQQTLLILPILLERVEDHPRIRGTNMLFAHLLPPF